MPSMVTAGTVRTVRHKGRDIHLFLRPDLYEQIASLAKSNRRTVTAELTLAVEGYLERMLRHKLAIEREARR